MQLTAIEFARDVLNYKDADSTEFNPSTKNPIIHILEEQNNITNMGGTLRLGLYNCHIKKGTKTFEAYQKEDIQERHRHRYELNDKYIPELEKHGLIATGINPERKLVEILELTNHPFFISCQFHPEFLSRPTRPHPLFLGFIKAANKNAN